MATQIFPFDTPGNYTFDSNKIAITGGKAKLKLVDSPGNDFQETFDNDTGFTYDPALSEFSGGQVQQKDARPANAEFNASYTNDEDADWSSGDANGTLFGTAGVAAGVLNLTTTGNKYCTYASLNNFDNPQVGCFDFEIIPNYTGIPVDTRNIFTLKGASNNSLIRLGHRDNGLIILEIIDNTGSYIINANVGSWSPSSGTPYRFELNFDITTGESRLFINGVQLGITIAGTGTRSAGNLTTMYLCNDTAGRYGDYYISQFVFYSAVQHTTNFTPAAFPSSYIYRETEVILPEMEYTGAGTLIAVTNFVSTFGGSPRIALQIGRSGDWLYWTGTEWVSNDDTYNQANDPATFAANAASLPVNGEIYGQFKIYFTDSSSQSSFADLIITLTAQIYPLDNPTLEINSQWYIDDLESFIEVATKTGSDEIKYILKKGTVSYYYSGTAWVESDGTYSQSNTAAEIQANKASFTDIKTYFGIVISLHSNNGITTPEIDTLTIQYSYAGDIPDTINECIVWGTFLDEEGNPMLGPVKVYLTNVSAQYKTGTLIRRKVPAPEMELDLTGYGEISLVETENMAGSQTYTFVFGYHDIRRRQVPDEPNKNFFDLLP